MKTTNSVQLFDLQTDYTFDDVFPSADFINKLIDIIPIPVFFKNTNGIYMNCNRAFEQFTRRSRDEIIGKTVYEIAPKEIADKYFEKDKALFENPGVQKYDWKVLQKNGMERNVQFHKSTFTDEAGNVAGIIGAIFDITEMKKAEEEREYLIGELQEALENVKTLNELLPICSYCKKIRDDEGYWSRVEQYITKHSHTQFSHTICPECAEKYHPGLLDDTDDYS